MTDTPSANETIGPVLGRTPSGLFILVAGDGAGNATGMLASWVQQASFDPPIVTVAVNRSRYLVDWLSSAPNVVLNLVGESQGFYLKHFGRGFEPGEPAFEGLATTPGPAGLPILDDALGHLAGRVVDRVETGDHVLHVVEVESAAAGPELDSQRPFVHVRKDGFNY